MFVGLVVAVVEQESSRIHVTCGHPQQSISIVQSWSLLVCVDQLMTRSEVFQGDLLVTTEKEDKEANRRQKCVQHAAMTAAICRKNQ
jgi:hypothetical protein